MAIKSEEGRVRQTRQRPLWPEGGPLESYGTIFIMGRVRRTIVGHQYVHIIHMLFDTLLRFSLVCFFVCLFISFSGYSTLYWWCMTR